MASLRPPAVPLRGFPRRSLRTSVEMYRIHPLGFGPGWFSSDGSGRFDLSPPAGTCYLALSAQGAFVEVFRDFTFVDAADVANRVISRLRASTDIALADCTSSRARGLGVTGSIHSTADYTVTQSWAAAFRTAGFGGVRYFCGQDPSQSEIGVALFGRAGEAELPVTETGPIDDDLIHTVEQRFNIHVLPSP